MTESKYEDAEYISRLGQEGDRIFGLIEWEYRKDGKVWRYIVVTTHAGELVIISTAVEDDGRIRYWTRQQKSFGSPSLLRDQPQRRIDLLCGQDRFLERAGYGRGKLIETASYDLGSAATSLQPLNGKLLALTHHDSIEIIDREEGEICHADPHARPASHWVEIAGSPPEDPMSAIIMVADRSAVSRVSGSRGRFRVEPRDVVFEADVPSLIRTFRRGRTQPLWHQGPSRDPRFGRLISTLDDAEILGMGLDGSLTHFTRLNERAWRLLRFIQNLAQNSEEVYPRAVKTSPDPEPRLDRHFEMHVDGDTLQRCLERQALESLVGLESDHMQRLIELLEEIDGGSWTTELARQESGQVSPEKYFQLAYDIIEYFLAPVL